RTDLVVCEAMRVARRGQITLARCLYLGLILVLLCLFFAVCFGQQEAASLDSLLAGQARASRVAEFAALFTCVFLGVQHFLVLALTPVYAGSSIAAEREAGTLENLLTTDLTPREIVISRVVAVIARLLLLLLTGLPLLALLLLFGGVPADVIGAACAATVLNLLSVAALGVAVSAFCARSRPAVAITLGLVAGFHFLSAGFSLFATSPPRVFAFLPRGLWGHLAAGGVSEFYNQAMAVLYGVHEQETFLEFLWRMSFFHLALTVIATVVAIRRLRSTPFPAPMPAFSLPVFSLGEPVRPWKVSLPDLDSSPMLW